MKIIYSIAGMALCALSMSAADNYRSVAISLNDGSKVEIHLTDELSASFNEENLVVTGIDADVTVPKAKIKSFSFSTVSALEAVETGENAPRVEGGELVFDALPANSTVAVYNAAGQLVSSAKVAGKYSVSLAGIPKGVALVNVNGLTYKIVVK